VTDIAAGFKVGYRRSIKKIDQRIGTENRREREREKKRRKKREREREREEERDATESIGWTVWRLDPPITTGIGSQYSLICGNVVTGNGTVLLDGVRQAAAPT